MNSGSGFLGNAAHPRRHLVPVAGFFLQHALEQIVDDLKFVNVGRHVENRRIVLRRHAAMDQERGVAAVVDDLVGTVAVRERQHPVGALPVILQRLALPGEYRNSGGRDRRRRMILSRKNIAARPAHVRAQRLQRLDQHRRLNGHMQAAGNPDVLERLFRAVLFARSHQPRHLLLRNGDFLAAEIGQRDLFNAIIHDYFL
ncbi:hypothetical protein SDC9_114740 [bioreactor metagenome]|uniref:Uncharacterized protein n=1 Tax=bioreactor metagenome TaxID=1076179 RepID=A0A645BR79_9ZZZZ